MLKLFDASTQELELATYLNRRGFRLESVSMYISEAGYCGVSIKRKKIKKDPYQDVFEEEKEHFDRSYRRISVFMLIDGENESLNDIYEKAENKQLRIISEISKGTEEGYLVMIDYVEKIRSRG